MIVFSPFGEANFILEPSVSYQAGKIDQGPLAGKASLTGPAVSLRAGIPLSPRFELGLESLYGHLAQEYQDNPQVIYGASQTQIGAYFAGNFSVCRTWAGLYPLDQLDIPTRDQTFTGMAARIGVGIPMMSKFNMSLDYTLHNYTQLETSTGKFDIPYNDGFGTLPFDVSTFTLSVSYILSL
ncbi:MAG: hypothetical protein SGJ18_13380 [Pseudomonadota bacterium]|nr:hypothetical protein [Pseudomonadota bacterium]